MAAKKRKTLAQTSTSDKKKNQLPNIAQEWTWTLEENLDTNLVKPKMISQGILINADSMGFPRSIIKQNNIYE